MAIERPARGGGHNKNDGDAESIGDIINAKQKQIEKKTRKAVEEMLAAPAHKLLNAVNPLTPPELKTEAQWLRYLDGLSIGQLSQYLEGKSPDSIEMEMGLALRTIAERFLKPTEKLPDDHNGWLDYFSTMTREDTEAFIETHRLNNEAKAAGMRWLQIAENPALIDKIINSRLESRKAEELGDIMSAAKSGDDLVLYEAIRNNIAYKIQEGSGARDMSVLIKQLNEVTTHLNAIYRERGMKDEQQSNIRKLLVSARQRSRRPKQQAKMTIADYEEDDGSESI